MTSEQKAALKAAREWLDNCLHAISSAPEADASHLAAFIVRREREAKIEVLEWARNGVYRCDPEMLDAEIARLERERGDAE
jgi:hypothetical protein